MIVIHTMPSCPRRRASRNPARSPWIPAFAGMTRPLSVHQLHIMHQSYKSGLKAAHHLAWIYALVLPVGEEHLSAYQCVNDALCSLDDAGLAAWQIVDPFQGTRLNGVKIEKDQVGIHARRDAPFFPEPEKSCRLRRQSPYRFL